MASTSTVPSLGSLPVKILTVGSAVGSVRDLFAKVKAINAKHGKFECVLCIGDFFGPLKEETINNSDGEDDVSQLLDGKLEAPLKCYIMQGENPLPEAVIEKYAKTGGELCKDVFLLNKSGIMTTVHGLRIACLGGIYNSEIYSSAESPPGFASPFFTSHTVERLLSNTLIKSSVKGKGQNYGSLAAIRDAASTSQLIDILITNDWPASITQFATTPFPAPELESIGASPLDNVIRKVKPRYHFAAAGGQPPKFWEREPFVWDDEQGRASRFVSLGAFGGEPTPGKKQRWFYAFSISPSTPETAVPPRPTNATKNPFTEVASRPAKRPLDVSEGQNFIWGNVPQAGGKRSRTDGPPDGKPPPGYKCRRCQSADHFINDCPDRTKPPEGYICKICNNPGHLVRDCPTTHAVGDTGGRKPREGYVCRACGSELHYLDDCPVANQRPSHGDRGRRAPPKEIGPDECWFCLSNPSLAKHLIVSIGSECYLTLPKGQIIPTQSASDHRDISVVPGGGHVLIVPITHQPTYTTIPSDIAPPILDETDKYKTALRGLYAKHGAAAVFFEVGRLSAKGGHAHVQAIPVPLGLQNKVEDAFLKEGRTQGIDFESDADGALEACAGGARSYFRVDLPDGRKLVHLMKDHVPFSIQFGRQVLVSLLDIPDRFDWKACMLAEEEDKADVQAFKAAFAPFDPSL
ncbi:nuclear protein [Leucogyrophana mollusca]|uniref:Nuclear protein n=1 Tax=Leucogyrophana mollusca TaxID=85980 RepID=A0ACB8B9C8_9AGAM|nr:nuclear protein [Leucogyrophana mollusca]